jgi:predicted transglutaminase-like cysteine proteinase
MQKGWFRQRDIRRFPFAPGLRIALAIGLSLMASISEGALAGESFEDEDEILPVSTFITASGQDAQPTRAWAEFCTNSPAECAIDRSEPRRVMLDPDVWNRIVEINRQVNLAIEPVPDRVHWGVEDRWDYPDDGQGDCEDIQLLKRKRLIDGGLPRRALRMAVVLDRVGAGHAVLLIHTDRGDFVLDNTVGAVLAWDETGYQFVKSEGQDDLTWIAFGDPQSAPVVTAQK